METETVIIGAGQAGLSVARYLKDAGRSFVILDMAQEIGSSWADRYDSLVLDSFAQYSHLEGFPFPGDQNRQPTKDEVAKYLKAFAAQHDLHPTFETKATKIQKIGGLFVVATERKIYTAKNVVLATGAFQKPKMPGIAIETTIDTRHLHSKDYKNISLLKPGATLVVGGGNSGAEIAKEVSASGVEVYFSYSGKLKSTPSSPLSQWLAYVLGLAHVSRKSLLGKLIIWYTKGKSVGTDVRALLSNKNILPVGRVLSVAKDGIQTEKGILPEIKNVIWATGYESDFSIVDIEDFDPSAERRGVTNVPGLYLLNIRWQWSKSSSHLAGVSRDAKYITDHIRKQL